MLTNTLCHLAALESDAGEREAAVAHAAEAVEAARGLGGPMLEMALDLSSYVARTVGDVDRAIEVAREAVSVGRTAPSLQLANALATLAGALSDAGRLDEAADAGLEALARSRSEFPAVRGEIATEVAPGAGEEQPARGGQRTRRSDHFSVAVGLWLHRCLRLRAALGVIDDGTHDNAVAQLIAAVSRHIDEPRLDRPVRRASPAPRGRRVARGKRDRPDIERRQPRTRRPGLHRVHPIVNHRPAAR